MSQLGDLLRESAERAESERTAIINQIDGRDSGRNRWRTLKQRLGFKGMGCCGPYWGVGQNTITRREDEEEEEEEEETIIINPEQTQNRIVDGSDPDPDPYCSTSVGSGMNLAAALELERFARPESLTETHSQVPLMRLLAETGSCHGAWVFNDSMCCVCMGREKGAAFVPCGHTFCRVCTRELWLNRGTCPLCNRSIFSVLDLY